MKVNAFPLIIILLLCGLTYPVWQWLWSEWWSNDYFTHGALITPVSLYLAWRMWQFHNHRGTHMIHRESDTRLLGIIVMSLGLIAYTWFFTHRTYYGAAYSMIVLFTGVIWVVCGLTWVKRLWFPLLFLVLMIPVPMLERVTLPLALFTGLCSGFITKLMGLDVSIVGSSVQLPNTNLIIGAQCSGINSIITLVCLTILVSYIVRGENWRRLLIPFLAVPLAMLGNVLRVATLIAFASRWGVERAFAFYHDYSGVIAFLLILVLFIPILKMLRCTTLRYEIL